MASFTVKLTQTAENDIKAIFAHIHKDRPSAATRLVKALQQKIMSLSQFPFRSPIISESIYLKRDYRHLIYQSYRLIYRIEATQVIVLRILHTARHLTPKMFPEAPP